MVLTYSKPTDLGMEAPDFDLPAANPDVDAAGGAARSLAAYAGADVLVVVFMCNHCPYVVHVEDALIDLAQAYQEQGVQVVGISSNDPEQYPADSFDNMARRAREKAYPFPYLYDATQEVARAYGAVCTPDIFVFDDGRRLVYRGRFDATRPGRGDATGDELRRALDELLETGMVTGEQYPAMGCNIKWK